MIRSKGFVEAPPFNAQGQTRHSSPLNLLFLGKDRAVLGVLSLGSALLRHPLTCSVLM